MIKIKATLSSGKVTSNSVEAQSLFEKSSFGEKIGEKILYSLPEALFLIQDNKMDLFDYRNKKLIEKEIIKKFIKLDKNFESKYPVFKDLRSKGYVVKTALKFGADFRVYEKGKKPNNSHSKWICFPISENKSITWQEFSAKNRVAHSTKKNLLIAVIDDENDISYYEIKWART
jgi:tRNA-intron endonuclease, archaea type